MKKALQPKGILLGILLLVIAVASSMAVYKLRHDQMVKTTEETETP